MGILVLALSLLLSSERWAAFYAADDTSNTLLSYDTLVFDGDNHPVLEPLKLKKLIGYLNVGEVEEDRWYFQKAKDGGLLLEENPNWPGSFFVDLRKPLWQKIIVEEVVPFLLFQGFNALFLDTLDNAAHLDAKYPGMKLAALNLVRAIKRNWPEYPIMLNRGYDLLDDLAPLVDMVLAESLMTTWDFKEKKYKKVPEQEKNETLALLKSAQEKNPKLVLYSLDYWDPSDTQTIKNIYKTERKEGLIPYVATIHLDRIIAEP